MKDEKGRINANLGEDRKKKIFQYCENNDLSVSEWIRRMIDEIKEDKTNGNSTESLRI